MTLIVQSFFCLPRAAFATCAALLFLAPGLPATQISYTEDTADFANPERGFYRQLESRSDMPDDLSNYDASYLTADNLSVVRRLYNMLSFRNAAISQDFLDHIAADLVYARSLNIKLNVRFAYTFNEAPPHDDAPVSRILAHISQLRPILQTNADVISHLDAGFIGRWGEWHTSSNNIDNTTDMRTVLAALHDALPANRSIVVRTPMYKRDIFQRQSAITEAEAFSGSDYSRTGHLNDCFLASDDDFGTYVPSDPASISELKNYIAADTQFVPMSGETCFVNPPRSDCAVALQELAQMHWSLLNLDFHPDVLQAWRTQGCFDEIKRRLGYRLLLREANLPNSVMAGGRLQGSITLQNVGFAAPFNARGLELVLRAPSGALRRLAIAADPRHFNPNDAGGLHTISLDLAVPADLTPGRYELLLALPDPMPGLYANPGYAIRLANIGTWEASSGFNKLLASVDVTQKDTLLRDGFE